MYFLVRHLKKRGVKNVKMIISDACLGFTNSAGEFFPETKWQRFTVHIYRNVFTVVPRNKMKSVRRMLKAIHASEDNQAAQEKAEAVIKKVTSQKFSQDA